ncbi:MAG: ABC transporter permease subunit, partial [Anaerolineae bacterium]
MTTRTSLLSSVLNAVASASPSTPEKPGHALLARGIAAAQAGDNAVARRLLGLALKQDPDSGQAWLWLSSVLGTPQGRAYCLDQALVRDPGNEAARRGLALLKDVPPALTLTAQPPAAHPLGWKRVWNRLLFRFRSNSGLGAAQRSRGTPGNASRIAKYALVRTVVLGLTVVVGVFVAILFINFGGFIDEIYRERIESAVAAMSRGMTGLTYEEKIQTLAPIKWEMEETAGLHAPFLSRCLIWLKHGLVLDLEDAPYLRDPSFERGSAGEIILAHLANTLLLAGAANLLLFMLGILAALMLSRRYGTWLDRVMIALSPISSAPNWVYGVMLTFVFAAQWRLLPFGGKYDAMPPSTKVGYVLVVLKHMILPVTAIFLSTFFQTAYAWRTYFLLHSQEDHVEMAEAQGLPARVIERRDIMRPALPYVLTSFALLIIGFWQGVLALEIFFNWPGLGALFVQAVWRPDRATVISLVVIFAYLLAISIFLLDLVYALVDPRVRIGGEEKKGRHITRKGRLRRLRSCSSTHLPWEHDRSLVTQRSPGG